MTREEQTISNLKKLKSFHNGSYGTDIDRAIKALEQEPFMNKPCVAHKVCHEDKIKVLEKIRAEIEPKCDRINSLASVLPYTAHREIQELLCDILELLQA